MSGLRRGQRVVVLTRDFRGHLVIEGLAKLVSTVADEDGRRQVRFDGEAGICWRHIERSSKHSVRTLSAAQQALGCLS